MGSAERAHPDASELVRFMRGQLPRSEVRVVVRHLLAGCPECVQTTRRLWKRGDPSLRLVAADPQGTGDPGVGRAERRWPEGEDELGKRTAR